MCIATCYLRLDISIDCIFAFDVLICWKFNDSRHQPLPSNITRTFFIAIVKDSKRNWMWELLSMVVVF